MIFWLRIYSNNKVFIDAVFRTVIINYKIRKLTDAYTQASVWINFFLLFWIVDSSSTLAIACSLSAWVPSFSSLQYWRYDDTMMWTYSLIRQDIPSNFKFVRNIRRRAKHRFLWFFFIDYAMMLQFIYIYIYIIYI